MPRHRPPPSLKEAATANVLRHMDSLWCRHFLETLYPQRTVWEHVVGPFDSLPASLASDILRRLKDQKRLRRHHINLLVSPGSRDIDAGLMPPAEAALLLQLAGARCADSLRRLSLNHSHRKFPWSAFNADFPRFTGLTSLDLSNTSAGDRELGVVSVYGAKLQELSVANSKVSDAGVNSLVLPVDPTTGAADDRFGQCRSLRRLDLGLFILAADISVEAVKNVLQNSPHLAYLRHPSVAVAVYECLVDAPESVFQLTSFFSDAPAVDDETIAAVVAACPRLAQFMLVAHEKVTELALLPLHTDKFELADLTLHLPIERELPIPTMLTPAISAHGHHLRTLELMSAHQVHFGMLIHFCPNLVRLSVSALSCTSESADGVKYRPTTGLRKLERLSLQCSHPALNADTLSLMIGGGRLQVADIDFCDALDDSVLEAALPSLSHMTALRITCCHNLTFGPLEKLIVSRENPLQEVALIRCQQINLAEVQNCNKVLEKMGLSDRVEVRWQ